MRTHGRAQARDDPDITAVYGLLAAGGVFLGLCYLYFQAACAWVCLVPLFYILEREEQASFLHGAAFGFAAGAVLYSWTFPVAATYAGRVTFLSAAFFLLALLYTSVFFGLVALGYAFIRKRIHQSCRRGIAVASFFTLMEQVKIAILPGLPWLKYNLALSQAGSLTGIQMASIGGAGLIAFVIVFVNYLCTRCVLSRRPVWIGAASLFILSYYGAGAFLAQWREAPPAASVSIALVTENMPAEVRWNEECGDSLVHVLFGLSEKAAESKPDLIVWTETSVPWKFSLDDDFLRRVLALTSASQADHLMGMFYPAGEHVREMYNSAFLLKHDGSVAARHDKQTLLDLLEKPIIQHSGLQLPLLDLSVFDNIVAGTRRHVVDAGAAKLGIFICNEILTGALVPEYMKEGNLFVLMSNDAWFEGTPVVRHHFLIARFHAVMAGRTIVINSNRGVCGLIRWNGEIICSRRSGCADVMTVKPELAAVDTLYARTAPYNVSVYIALFLLPCVRRRQQ